MGEKKEERRKLEGRKKYKDGLEVSSSDPVLEPGLSLCQSSFK